MRHELHFGLFLVLSLVGFTACQEALPATDLGFYYWRTRYAPTEAEKTAAEQGKGLYIRYFDVAWDSDSQLPTPVAPIQWDQNPTVAITPVVFIKNEVFLHLDDSKIDTLAAQIFAKIKQMHPHQDQPIKALQMDCDWSGKTAAGYFQFLKSLRKFVGNEMEISCTLRLHQLKYQSKTGVPPVDRVSLMIYNAESAAERSSINTLMDERTLAAYVHPDLRYPLPLDLALPIHHQCIWYRYDLAMGLLPSLDPESLKDPKLFRSKSDQLYEVQVDTLWQQKYFKAGDLIKYESVSPKTLEGITQPLVRQFYQPGMRRQYFELQEPYLSKYSSQIFYSE